MASYTIKFGRWFSFLTGCFLFGCTSGPQQKGIWPWEYGKDFGKYQTGDYVSVSGNVAQFGEPPTVAKPVTPETPAPPVADVPAPAETGVKTTARPEVLPDSRPYTGKTVNNVTGDYDFKVVDIKLVPPAYLPVNSVRKAFDITAFNHGNAPVTVTIDLDPTATYNASADKDLPLVTVIAPHTDQVVLHISPKLKNEAYKFRYSYRWNIGDYTTKHNCPEHYQFPFGNNIQAYARVSDPISSTPDTRYAVVFSMPAGTPVRAARKGTVVRITADDRVDILHDDSTIATYYHLGKTGEDLMIGMAVTAGDIIGIAGAAGNRNEAYMQLMVWRTEFRPSQTGPSSDAVLEMVSLPMEFCSAAGTECRVLSQNQAVSRNKPTETKKAGKRTSKSTAR